MKQVPQTNRTNVMWRWLRRWRRTVRHQVTWSGLAFTFLIVMVGLGAFASANNLLFLLLAALLSTMLMSGFVSRLSLSGLEVKLMLPDHVFARRKLPAAIQLRNAKSWMPSFSIHLSSTAPGETPMQIYFPIVPGGATLETMTNVQFQRRGIHGDSEYQFTTRFPFGFTERRLQVELRREVLVYPAIDPQPGFDDLLFAVEGEMEARLRGRGSDFYRIRPYQSTESSRHVDWKATAHTGELQVREFAREEDLLVEIFLDLQVPFSETAWLDQAVDCCAYLCWNLARKNGRLRLVSQTADIRFPITGDVYTMLKHLALAEPARVRTPVHPNESSSLQVVFSLNPKNLEEGGWRAVRVVGRDAFPHSSDPQPVGSGKKSGSKNGSGENVRDRGRRNDGRDAGQRHSS
jgi:uncharacterized protein (DUF58 family)